jgi:hypothetical protein
MYNVTVIIWTKNKHLLQQSIFVFRDMSLCLIWMNAFIHSDSSKN